MNENAMKWSAWIAALAGLCLLAAPFVTGYSALSTVATGEAVVLGLLIAALAAWTAAGKDVPAYADYGLLACGLWSIVAPFALSYSSIAAARNCDVIVGIVVTAVAAYRAFVATPGARRRVTA
jgi:hypothetical protein